MLDCRMRFLNLFALLFCFVNPQRIFCQQDYVGRFDLYNGLTWFDRLSAKLQERGYHLRAGVNDGRGLRWVSIIPSFRET